MALTEKNRIIIRSRVGNYDTRMELEEAVERGNIDSNVLEEILIVLKTVPPRR
jgi:hypothetical protein